MIVATVADRCSAYELVLVENMPSMGRAVQKVASSVTRTEAAPPPKRRPGRPQGSKNRVSADARALLASDGLAGIKQLCAIAAGRTIYRPLRGGAARELLIPDLDQMLTAQRIIVSRLIPELKAADLTIEQKVTPYDEPRPDVRKVARALLSLLHGNVDGEVGSN
jgi:hypothetical protein